MKRIKLRALTKSDLEKTLEWHNQEDILNYYSKLPFPVNRELEEKWFEKILTSNFPVTVFGIEIIEQLELIGITVLSDIDLINRSAEFGIFIGEKKQRGKGYAIEATQETLSFGFYKLGLNRIFVRVLEDNKTTIKLNNSIGFIREGILRQNVFKNNEYKSSIIMSILKSEYQNNSNIL